MFLLPLGVAAAAGHLHGSLDPSFGKGGKVTTAIGSDSLATAVAIQKDGKLVTAGPGTKDSTVVFAVVRYKANGSLDWSFGKGGKVMTAIGSHAEAAALVIQRDGKLVAAGVSGNTSHAVGVLARYTANGTLDLSFGLEGGRRARDPAGRQARRGRRLRRVRPRSLSGERLARSEFR